MTAKRVAASALLPKYIHRAATQLAVDLRGRTLDQVELRMLLRRALWRAWQRGAREGL